MDFKFVIRVKLVIILELTRQDVVTLLQNGKQWSRCINKSFVYLNLGTAVSSYINNLILIIIVDVCSYMGKFAFTWGNLQLHGKS